MNFRLFTPEDYDDYYAFRLLGLQQAPHMFATDANTWESTPTHVFEKHLEASQSRRAPILGVWQDDQIIGMVGLKLSTEPTVAHKATLWGGFVSPQHRRQGIAKQLLAFAIKTAQKLNHVRQLRVVINASNQEAISLFENAGFEQFGLEPKAKLVDGEFQDQLYFWYPLKHNEDY